jgi:ParB/RepB/Spo0J family partition protein
VPAKQKKSALDVGYLRTATSSSLASSVFSVQVQEEEQRLIHEKQPQQIAIELLHNNPYQPRVAIEEESLQQLADTIASQGFQGVLVARSHPQKPGAYQITAGHRRREAAKRAGLTTLPAIVHPWSDQEMATLAATENIQREDLSPLEEGRLFQLMIDELGLTQVEVANAVKKDRGYVRNRLRLATAPEDIQAFIIAKTDSMRAVIYLLDIEDPTDRAPVIEQLLKRTLTTEDLPAYVEELKRRKLAPPAPPAMEMAPRQTERELISWQQPTSNDAEKQSSLPRVSSTPNISEPLAPDADHHASQRMPSQTRVRLVKLKTILRYITEYQKSLGEQDELSGDEWEIFQRIEAVVQALSQREV